jgi:hypothetical protein
MANTKNMNNVNDTQELDKKKLELNSGSTTANKSIKNIGSFLISLLIAILLVVGYFIFSSIILYECKLAQSNIVPTSLECYPYTDTKPEIQSILTNIFITNTEPQESVKLSFPYDKYNNSKNTFLDIFRKYKEQPSSNFLINYMIAILEGLINYSNNALTYFFNLLNGMPEMLVILLGPILSTIYFCLAPIIGIFVFVYHYFSEMSWFFKENTNSNLNKPKWTNINLFEPVSYGTALFLVFIFFILFWILLFTITPMLSIIIFYMCLFMTIGYKGEIEGKKVTILTIIKEMFKTYKVTITVIFSVMIVLSAFSHLGALPGVFSILTVLLIYFKFIPMNVFESIKVEHLSPLSSFEQATKKCNALHGYTPKSFSELFGNFFDASQKGGGISRELKRLHKKMK